MRIRATFILFLSLLLLVGLTVTPESFVRSVGLRIVAPWAGMPTLVGVQVNTDLGFGLGTASFFLSTLGEGVATIGTDIALTEPAGQTMAYLRLLTGFYYFDLSAFAPSLLFGGGMAFESNMLDPILFGLAAEFIYPIALPIPMFSTYVGWALP